MVLNVNCIKICSQKNCVSKKLTFAAANYKICNNFKISEFYKKFHFL